jgi:hypothetical protein
MAVTSVGADTQTAVIDTEHTLDTEIGAGVYILVVDTTNMALGDIVTLRMKTKNQNGSSSVLAYQQVFSHVQLEINKYSPAIPIDTELIVTLEQTDGVGRDFDWNLLKIS